MDIYNNGEVFAYLEFTLDVSCIFDFNLCPYDEQQCKFGFFVANEYPLIKLHNLHTTFEPLNLYQKSLANKTQVSKWKITKFEQDVKSMVFAGKVTTGAHYHSISNNVIETIEVTLSFQRKDIYFNLTFILPVFLTSIITIFALVPFVKTKLACYIILANFICHCFYFGNLVDTIPLTVNGIPSVGN